MRVLVVDPSLFTLPYDRFFCRALAENGVDVTLVGRPLRAYEDFANEPFAFHPLFYQGTSGRELGWQTSHLGRIRKGFEHVLGFRALERLAKEQRVDIVHIQWLLLPFFDRIALKRLRRHVKLVLTVHNAEIAAHSNRAVIGWAGAILQAFGRNAAALSFDRYIAHTEKTVNSLMALGIKPEQILHLSHPPLDLDLIMPSEPTTDDRREILLFGSIKPYKGVDVLVEAGLALAARRSDFRIVIAGRPFQPLDTLKARIAAAGAESAFRFDLDYLPDAKLAAYLASASIVVFPYREIDGSGALALAARFGKAIVASSIGVFAEAPVRDHVELIPVADPTTLAATLERLLDEPATLDELTRRSAQLETMLPSWDDFARSCTECYHAIDG